MSHAIPVNLCTLFLVDSMHDTHETLGQHLLLDTAEAQCSRKEDDEFRQHACGQFLLPLQPIRTVNSREPNATNVSAITL